TPTMWIDVSERLVMHQASTLLERGDDDRIRLIDFQASDQWGARVKAAVVAHRIRHGQVITLPNSEVLMTMTRCGMHGARTRIECHVLTEDDRNLPVLERVLQHQ